MNTSDPISRLGYMLMRAVVNSGAATSENADMVVAILRAEMKKFIIPGEDATGKYADERALILTGSEGLAMASLAAECIRLIIQERDLDAHLDDKAEAGISTTLETEC